MSQGAVIFAFNTRIDYVSLAREAARRVRDFLDLPTTLITDEPGTVKGFDQVIVVDRPPASQRLWQDRDRVAYWHNHRRCCAWELSPYDDTLLIDCDYWISSDRLQTIMDDSADFRCFRGVMNLPRSSVPTIQKFGNLATDMWWATVVKFSRTDRAQEIFECWDMIEKNYEHYADLFGFSKTMFRNDYALSLSLLLVHGHLQPRDVEIPWPLINVEPQAQVKKSQDAWELYWIPPSSATQQRLRISDLDLHFMGKLHIEESLSEV